MDCLQHLLSAPPTPAAMPDIAAWWSAHLRLCERDDTPIARAILAGFGAAQPGHAFLSGYQEALAALLGEPGATTRRALCATEAGGNHPRAIETTLSERGGEAVLSGEKRFVTLASEAEVLLVLARSGTQSDGRPALVAVALPSDRAGVTMLPASARGVAIVPEVPHARCRFEAVLVGPGERLPGDGYSRYLKPFRSFEDLHVMAALTAWALQVGRRAAWPAPDLEAVAATLAGLHSLSGPQLMQPATHIALAGLLRQVRGLLCERDDLWQRADERSRTAWARDRALLDIAQTARARRAEVAWRQLDAAGG